MKSAERWRIRKMRSKNSEKRKRGERKDEKKENIFSN
jgi:hypothetical protein